MHHAGKHYRLESDNGCVVVKVKDESFELAYDKLIDEKTGEIKEIEIPNCITGIGAGVFRDIQKILRANSYSLKIKNKPTKASKSSKQFLLKPRKLWVLKTSLIYNYSSCFLQN